MPANKMDRSKIADQRLYRVIDHLCPPDQQQHHANVGGGGGGDQQALCLANTAAQRDIKKDYGGAIIAEYLYEYGVRQAFTLTGVGHVSPVIVGCKQKGIKVIDVRHEATAVFAADAVARITGFPGVAIVTAGPGLTNTITPVKNAQMAGSPLLLFAGATATLLKGRGSLQDIDQVALMRPHVKKMYSPKTVAELPHVIEDAFKVAQAATPGPVCIELPLDLLYPPAITAELYGIAEGGGGTSLKKEKQQATNNAPSLAQRIERMFLRRHYNQVFKGFSSIPAPRPDARHILLDASSLDPPLDSSMIETCASWLLESKRPVLVIGSQSVQRAHMAELVRSSVEMIAAPTFLASMARGLLGRESRIQFRHKRAEALKACDMVILAGMPFDFRMDYGKSINKSAKVVSINTDREQLSKNKKPDLAVLANPGAFLIELARQLEGTKGNNKNTTTAQQRWSGWFAHLAKNEETREHQIAQDAQIHLENNLLNPVKVCMEIEKHIADESIIVADGGDFVATSSYIVKPRAPLSWLDPGAFGTLGVGAGFAMGAKVVHPEKEVWIIYGDGSCGYSLIEFDTFVRHKIPVIAVVGNDACWMQMYRGQIEIFHDDTACLLDYSAKYHEAVKAFGAEGFLVTDERDLVPTLMKAKRAAREGKPVLVNVHIGRHEFRKGSISL